MTDSADPKNHPALALTPRGMNVIAAAKYWGDGVAPAPLKITEIDRNISDGVAIGAAMSVRSVGARKVRA